MVQTMNRCLCGGCDSCLRAQGYDPAQEQLAEITDELAAEYIASASKIEEAFGYFMDSDYTAIAAAMVQNSKEALFEAFSKAIHEVITPWAKEDAAKLLIDMQEH